MSKKDYDVIVVGAGLAGLSAAQQLSLVGKRVVVLEASNRIGGRVYQERVANINVDLGATFLDQDHDKMLELLDQYHLIAKEQISDSLYQLSPALPLGKGLWGRYELRKFRSKLKESLTQIDLEKPWSSASAATLDQTTFSEFLKGLVILGKNHRTLKNYFDLHLGYDTSCLSALDVLFQLKSNRFDGDGQTRKAYILPVGSFQKLIKSLAFELDIKLQHPVHEIEQGSRSVTVSGAFFQYTASQVVLAIPTHGFRSIHFSPAISKSRQALWNQVFSTEEFRLCAVFADPFWGKEMAPIVQMTNSSFQRSQFRESPSRHGVLISEARGEKAHELSKMKAQDRESLWKQDLSKVLRQDLPDHLGIVSKYWNDDFWDCGASSYRPLGSWTTYQNLLAKSTGRIHWAGTETSLTYYGSMEGAVRSGLRAADEILSKSRAYHGP